MANYMKEVSEVSAKLKRENRALRQQLKEAKESIDAIKSGNYDALATSHENNFKVFTETTSDKPYRLLIENMHEGAVMLNEDRAILYCNSSFASMVNLPLQKIIGTMFEKYIVESIKEHFVDFLKQDQVNWFNEEGHLCANGGKCLPVLMTTNALTLNNIVVLNIILTDLTIQNEHQERLKRKAKVIKGKSKELENINKELAFQIGEKEKRAEELVIANIELALAEELVIAYKELAFQTGEKEKRTSELSTAITDVKELERLNLHKANTIAIIAHDLRSPLSGIIQIAELLKDDFKTMQVDDLQKMLNHLYNLTTEELYMLDYLVEWARIKYAAEAFTPSYIGLSQYVNKAFDTLNEMALANTVHLQNEIIENITVFADSKMLLSILQNIISNSIKNTPSGGEVTASAKRDDDRITVEIKDTGIGMSKEVVEKLFAPQMDSLSTARKEKKGAGIGLLLIKGFVDKNGGEICVESIEGKGTSFYFTLPARNPFNA